MHTKTAAMKIAMTFPYTYRGTPLAVGGSGKLSPAVASMVLLALLTRLPS